MGDAVGALVGGSVGDAVGAPDGRSVGAAVGALDGTRDGAEVGVAVGSSVGADVGPTVGDGVGALVGGVVGAPVGTCGHESHAPGHVKLTIELEHESELRRVSHCGCGSNNPPHLGRVGAAVGVAVGGVGDAVGATVGEAVQAPHAAVHPARTLGLAHPRTEMSTPQSALSATPLHTPGVVEMVAWAMGVVVCATQAGSPVKRMAVARGQDRLRRMSLSAVADSRSCKCARTRKICKQWAA